MARPDVGSRIIVRGLFGLRSLQADAAARRERAQTGHTEAVHVVGVGELSEQNRADLGSEQVVEATVQAREDQIERPEQLVDQSTAGVHPPVSQRRPDELLNRSICPVLRRPAATSDDEVDNRGRVGQIGLEPSLAVLRAHRLHVPRVQLNNIVPACDQPRDDRAVVVAGGLNTNAHRKRRACRRRTTQVLLQSPHARLVQRERQRLPDQLPAMIGDQAQSLVLPDINPGCQTSRRVKLARLDHVLPL